MHRLLIYFSVFTCIPFHRNSCFSASFVTGMVDILTAQRKECTFRSLGAIALFAFQQKQGSTNLERSRHNFYELCTRYSAALKTIFWLSAADSDLTLVEASSPQWLVHT